MDRQAGGGLDAEDRGFEGGRRCGGEHEPHVQRMLAFVVVRDLGEGVDEGGDALEVGLRHREGCKQQRAAEPLGMKQRPEARQHAPIKQALQPLQYLGLAQAEFGPDRRIRRIDQRQAALQAVDQRAIGGIERRPRGGGPAHDGAPRSR